MNEDSEEVDIEIIVNKKQYEFLKYLVGFYVVGGTNVDRVKIAKSLVKKFK